jgi:nucleotide-binding universal stress UspA family protein
MLETALVAVGDDWGRMELVVESAAEILEAMDVDPVLLHVFSDSEFKKYLETLEYESADPDDVASRHEGIQRAADRFHDAGLEPTVVGVIGDPVDEIISCIERHEIDHVFTGGRDRSPAGKAILGSVSQGVLRQADVPCTLIMS